MNRKDIIAMAREAVMEEINDFLFYATDDNLERFAALVAAKEREACILEIRMHTPRDGRDSPGWKRMNSLIEAINARGAQQ